MKSATKKMILIPEEEYVALTRLFAGDDPMKVEKARTDMQIRRVLSQKGQSPLETGKKYDLLAKKRRKIIRQTQERVVPALQQVVEQATETPSPAPTTGIVPAQVPARILQQAQQSPERSPEKKLEQEEKQRGEEVGEQEEEPQKYSATEWNRILKNIDTFRGILDRDRYDFVYDHVDKNRRKFGILTNGQVARNSSRPEYSGIEGSSFEEVLLFLTGQQNQNPDNILAYQKLIPRLYKDRAIFKHFTRKALIQEGKGTRKKSSKYIVDLKYRPIKHKKLPQIKTPGLIRQPKFKPKLWTRIGV